jgi:hypothetical protein
MGLLGLGFNVVTLPGIVVNQVVQGVFEERYGAPTEKFAVPDDLDETELAENPDRLSEVRALDADEDPKPYEMVEYAVDYEAVEGYSRLFALVLGPFFLTSLLALALFGAQVAAALGGVASRQGNTLLWLLGFYPGFAVAAHAFPGSEQTDALFERSGQTASPLRVVGYPLVALSKLTNLSRFLWVDAAYAVLLYLAVAVPLGVL